ncbi:hypothetical protein GUJ93_ZPchr0009g1783 [Zizania palustris]|uniref:Uncharacterized protein n=1 Tax=Zizania palustris TaxID=103762 RepID=A0A8J5R897_ZIZPA|nr:hypothetical protein GUJ93_ZPchr0009g1783 [Zizania palustris]
METNISNVPEGVLTDQWIAFVNNWMTTKAQDISEANRTNCGKRKATHTAGPKSFARNRDDLGCLDGPLSTTEGVQTTTIRKCVCNELLNEEFGMLDELSYTMRDQTEDGEFEDIQPHNKCTKTQDKTEAPIGQEGNLLQAKRVSTIQKSKQLNARRERLQASRVPTSQKAKPIQIPDDNRFDKSNYINASKVIDQETTPNSLNHQPYKNKPGSTQRPSHNAITVGTQVFLKIWRLLDMWATILKHGLQAVLKRYIIDPITKKTMQRSQVSDQLIERGCWGLHWNDYYASHFI